MNKNLKKDKAVLNRARAARIKAALKLDGVKAQIRDLRHHFKTAGYDLSYEAYREEFEQAGVNALDFAGVIVKAGFAIKFNKESQRLMIREARK